VSGQGTVDVRWENGGRRGSWKASSRASGSAAVWSWNANARSSRNAGNLELGIATADRQISSFPVRAGAGVDALRRAANDRPTHSAGGARGCASRGGRSDPPLHRIGRLRRTRAAAMASPMGCGYASLALRRVRVSYGSVRRRSVRKKFGPAARKPLTGMGAAAAAAASPRSGSAWGRSSRAVRSAREKILAVLRLARAEAGPPPY
jgi:hypothetical protein